MKPFVHNDSHLDVMSKIRSHSVPRIVTLTKNAPVEFIALQLPPDRELDLLSLKLIHLHRWAGGYSAQKGRWMLNAAPKIQNMATWWALSLPSSPHATHSSASGYCHCKSIVIWTAVHIVSFRLGQHFLYNSMLSTCCGQCAQTRRDSKSVVMECLQPVQCF